MKKKKAYTFRKFMTDVHLWLGLASGIILFLVCFSGTMLVFEKEIESFFAEELRVVPSSEKLSIDELTSRMSEKGTVSSVSIPTEASEAYEFRVKTSPKDRRGTTFMMDPYSAVILKPEPSPLDGFFSVMFRMHRWLLLDTSIGRPIVGVATIIFLFLSISGIIIWFPKKWKWKAFKPGFKIKWSANWKRINHDLHNTLGFYSCIVLVIMILTGLCWSFEWYREAGSQVLGTKIFGGRGGPGITSETPGSKVISLSEAYTISGSEFQYAGKTSITIPQEETDVLEIRKYGDDNWSPSTSDLLVLDRDGSVLKKELFDDKDLNIQVASLIKPLHTGEIFGTLSKIIYFLACLIATSLPVTGTIIWLNKMKKKKKRKL